MPLELFEFSDKPFARRNFIISASKSILAAGILGSLSSCKTQTPVVSATGGSEKPIGKVRGGKVSLPPIDASTEKPKETPNPLPLEKRIGYAIVGLGHLALDEIMPAFGLCKNARVTALVSGNREKALTVASQYGISEKNIYDYQNYDSIKDNPDVDVIYIILPNSMHAEYTIRGAKAGKHILCEKPMANSVQECQDMIQACKEAQVKLMIAYRIQYEPYNNEIKKLVRDKKYGKVKYITATNGQNAGDPEHWRMKKKLAGGGSLPDIGLYCLNTIRFLTGEEPVEVYGKVFSTPDDRRFKEVEETVLFQMRFPSGILADCTTSYGIHTSRYYRVHTEQAFYGLDPAFSYTGLKMHSSHTEGSTEVYQTPALPDKNQFSLEMDHFADCIIKDKIPYTPGEEGLQDQKIMEAIYQSAAKGSPVALKEYKGKDIFRGNNE